jgi:hypothetical protein
MTIQPARLGEQSWWLSPALIAVRRIYDVTICEAFDSVGVQSNL